MTSMMSSFVENDLLMPPIGFSNADELDGGNQYGNQMESELKKLFLEEKERNDQLKKYYETLKTDYSRSQSEVLELQTQLRNLIEENKVMQEKYRSMFDKMQQELRKKQLYIEDLKNKELDEVKLEKLKDELSQEIEMPYKDIVKQFELELEKLHQECNRMRYENGFLKSSNDHDKTEFQTLIEQLKLKHEIELNAMRKDRDLIRVKLQEHNHAEATKIKEILKENGGLKVKLKALIEENEELREKFEHHESHQNSIVRNNSKVVSDLTAKISMLESEKESLKHQSDNSYKETLNLNETIANNIRKIHDLERENSTLKLHIEEVQYNSKKEIANLKFDFTKERGEFTRAKETFANQIEEIKTQLEISESNVRLAKRQLDEKEREITKNVNSANEENWIKINELTNEKLDLESKLQISQKDLDYKTNILQADKDKCEEKLRTLEKQRDEIYRENNRLRALISESENVRSELEREQEKNRELYKKCHKLETELAANNGLEQELTEINLKLKNELAFYTQEMQKSKEHLQRMKDEFENRFSDMKTQYIAEKSEYHLKYEEVQSKLNKTNAKIGDMQTQHESRKKQYQNYMKKIKNKTELLNAKLREFKIKEQALKDCVPLEMHNKVKKQLQDLLKRHQDFRNVLVFNQPNNNSVKVQPQQMNLMQSAPIYNNNLVGMDSIGQEFTKEIYPSKVEFDEIRNRLDSLTQKQNEHLKEIVGTKGKSHQNVIIKVASDSSTETSRSVSPGFTKKSHSKSPIASSKKLESSIIIDERPASKSPASQTKAPAFNPITRPKTPPFNQSRTIDKKLLSDESSEIESEEMTPKNEKEILADWNKKSGDQSITTDIKTTSRMEKYSKEDTSTNSSLNNSLKANKKKSNEIDSYEDDFNSSKSSI